MKLRKLWHSVRGYDGLYQVSNFGEIKSLPRRKHLPNGKYTVSKEKLLSPARIGKDGYEFVYLTVGGESKRFYVHRIVAEAFLPNPDGMPFVNHINGLKFDNRLENLEWCSRSKNAKHAYRVLGVGRTCKIAQYDKRGNYIKTWANAYQAQEELGINRGNINSCVNKHRKTAGGFRWEAICY